MPEKILETRQATAGDLDYAWSVYSENIRPYIEPKLKDTWVDAKQKERFLTIWRPEESYMITVDEKPIGWGAAKISDKEVTLIHHYIEPAAQRKGYSTRLLSELLKEWTGKGRTVHAEVLRDPQAQALYQRLGFIKIKEAELTDLMQFTAKS